MLLFVHLPNTTWGEIINKPPPIAFKSPLKKTWRWINGRANINQGTGPLWSFPLTGCSLNKRLFCDRTQKKWKDFMGLLLPETRTTMEKGFLKDSRKKESTPCPTPLTPLTLSSHIYCSLNFFMIKYLVPVKSRSKQKIRAYHFHWHVFQGTSGNVNVFPVTCANKIIQWLPNEFRNSDLFLDKDIERGFLLYNLCAWKSPTDFNSLWNQVQTVS